jgi:hypothetical protein
MQFCLTMDHGKNGHISLIRKFDIIGIYLVKPILGVIFFYCNFPVCCELGLIVYVAFSQTGVEKTGAP